MLDFINHGYPRQALDETTGETYTLFYNPHQGFLNADWKCIQDSTGFRGGSQAAGLLASAMRLAARDRLAVNWTVHERGAAIFKQALRQLAKQGSANLADQQVFYANPVVSLMQVDNLRKKVGMTLSEKGFVMNDLSLHQSVVADVFGLCGSSRILWQTGKKGHALVKPVLTASAIAGLFSNPGTAGMAAYGITALAFAGANLLPGKSNRAIIEGPGDAIQLYLFGRKGR